MSSLVPSSTSCQPFVAPPSTEPQDSQRTVSEVVVGVTRLSGDDAAADLVAPEVTVAIAAGSSEAPALGSSVALVPSSSVALVPSSFGAPVPATPLLPLSGGDVFAAVVPPARSSFGLMRKKIAE